MQSRTLFTQHHWFHEQYVCSRSNCITNGMSNGFSICVVLILLGLVQSLHCFIIDLPHEAPLCINTKFLYFCLIIKLYFTYLLSPFHVSPSQLHLHIYITIYSVLPGVTHAKQ